MKIFRELNVGDKLFYVTNEGILCIYEIKDIIFADNYIMYQVYNIIAYKNDYTDVNSYAIHLRDIFTHYNKRYCGVLFADENAAINYMKDVSAVLL